MAQHPLPRPWSDVDASNNPAHLVDTLRRRAGSSFHTGYKQRLRALLRARPGQRFLDVGAGTGETVLALAAESGAQAVAADLSLTMAAAMRAGGVRGPVVADAHHLPFREGSFDGAWADLVLQHVADPARVVDEMLRVVRPGGRIVLAAIDYGTQVLDIGAPDLARRILRLRVDPGVRGGALAHQHPGMLAERGLREVAVEAHALVVRDPRTVDHVLGIRDWARTAADQGHITSAEATDFTAHFDHAAATGRFTYAVTFFLTSATAIVTAGPR
ncbi:MULTISPECIES: methyltransferase domain-containing protein [Streptomyces]|uniref:Methyltransferase domain-containing protein n=1 Tax=Streptomyces morookaense TaxID=1970 RepID=A0A7Y7B368_STRMO|nr:MULTISPECIES: methyltransferase domain-containing protein [Streptomyces]MCC2279320.1 methyltransferase domain-containing protein [Streptomyces sp. ET3-23]NVK78186.1 methyltransferase domain-containing protein [Streptomyces morookaense]GHF31507.1 hypothetical protein GCM10010359_37340 [Streptomyces morookaense]